MLDVEGRGARDVAKRVHETTSQIFRFAIAHGIGTNNPAALFKPRGILLEARSENHARVDARDLPKLLVDMMNASHHAPHSQSSSGSGHSGEISRSARSERPATAPQMPTARAFGYGNALAIIDSATGFSIDAPSPCSAGNPISCSIVLDWLHSSEPSVNTPSPIWNTLRRPNRSDIDPASIKKLATTSV